MHPVFRVLKLRERISKWREAKASDRCRLLQNYIYRSEKKLSSIKDPEKLKKAQEKIEAFKEEKLIIEDIHNL